MHNLLIAQSSLTAIVPAARFYQAGAVVDNPPKPFVVERWLAPVPGAAKQSYLYQLRVDVHDVRGSYSRIDQFIKALYPVLYAVSNFTGSDGRLSQCDFVGTGGDQEDATYGTNFSFSSWQVIGVRL